MYNLWIYSSICLEYSNSHRLGGGQYLEIVQRLGGGQYLEIVHAWSIVIHTGWMVGNT